MLIAGPGGNPDGVELDNKGMKQWMIQNYERIKTNYEFDQALKDMLPEETPENQYPPHDSDFWSMGDSQYGSLINDLDNMQFPF